MQHFARLSSQLRPAPRAWVYFLGTALLVAALAHAQHGVSLEADHLAGTACEYCAASGAAPVSADLPEISALPRTRPTAAAAAHLIDRAVPTPRGRAPPAHPHV